MVSPRTGTEVREWGGEAGALQTDGICHLVGIARNIGKAKTGTFVCINEVSCLCVCGTTQVVWEVPLWWLVERRAKS